MRVCKHGCFLLFAGYSHKHKFEKVLGLKTQQVYLPILSLENLYKYAVIFLFSPGDILKELCHEIQPNWEITKCSLN